MRAKPDLIPDCDVDGEPMYKDECPASAIGLKERRDVYVWRCAREGCGRYFYGTLGYRYSDKPGEIPTEQCPREGAFLVTQRALGSSICPVDGCKTAHVWHGAEPQPAIQEDSNAREAALLPV